MQQRAAGADIKAYAEFALVAFGHCHASVWCPLAASCADYIRTEGVQRQPPGVHAVEPQGADCSGQWMYWGDNSVNCYSNCSDAGVCKSGWCHCEPGRWGIDCSRTKVSFRLWFTFLMPDPCSFDFPPVIAVPLDAEMPC